MAWIWQSLGSAIGRRAHGEAAETASSPTRDTVRMDAAFAYTSRLTLAQQRDRLNTFGPYIWVDRDSHWYPDYISTRCYPDYGFFKIVDAVDGRFNLTIKLVTDREMVREVLAKLVDQAGEHVLPMIDAEDVEDAEPYD
jgi:hypothetical protein